MTWDAPLNEGRKAVAYRGTEAVGVRWGELASIEARPIVRHGSTSEDPAAMRYLRLYQHREMLDTHIRHL